MQTKPACLPCVLRKAKRPKLMHQKVHLDLKLWGSKIPKCKHLENQIIQKTTEGEGRGKAVGQDRKPRMHKANKIWFSILKRVVIHFGLSLIIDEKHRLTHTNTILPRLQETQHCLRVQSELLSIFQTETHHFIHALGWRSILNEMNSVRKPLEHVQQLKLQPPR